MWPIHTPDLSLGFVDAGSDGRFNLADMGPCYLAEEPIGAFVEKFGRLLRPGCVIPEPLVDAQRLSRLQPSEVDVVDLADPKVLGLAAWLPRSTPRPTMA